MFCPAASPVEKLKRRYTNLFATYGSTYSSLATEEVASASSRMCSILAFTQVTNSRPARASAKTNTGARCMASATTVDLTPPHAFKTLMPRLWEAIRVPSEVANGIKNSPSACSPRTRSGPAHPMGTWATPTKFSPLPDDFGRVVVALIARQVDGRTGSLRDGVLHFELQLAKRARLDRDFDLMFALGELGRGGPDGDDGT